MNVTSSEWPSPQASQTTDRALLSWRRKPSVNKRSSAADGQKATSSASNAAPGWSARSHSRRRISRTDDPPAAQVLLAQQAVLFAQALQVGRVGVRDVKRHRLRPRELARGDEAQLERRLGHV